MALLFVLGMGLAIEVQDPSISGDWSPPLLWLLGGLLLGWLIRALSTRWFELDEPSDVDLELPHDPPQTARSEDSDFPSMTHPAARP